MPSEIDTEKIVVALREVPTDWTRNYRPVIEAMPSIRALILGLPNLPCDSWTTIGACGKCHPCILNTIKQRLNDAK